MTIEELAELSGTELKKLTDEELDKVLRPYYIVTRPECVIRTEKKSQQTEMAINLTPQKRAALALMAEEGIDLSFLRMKRKKV